jgi:tetratricopeptide (TPR) repeat protein
LASAGRAADQPGQEDLDKASQAKLSARSTADRARSLADYTEAVKQFGEAITLSESALKKGLDKDGEQLAQQIIVSTLLDRAKLRAGLALATRVKPEGKDYRKEALEDLERAVKMNAELPDALLMIARLNLLQGGDRKRAMEAIDQAIATKEDPRLRAQAYVLRATLAKEPEKKLADLGEAIKLQPNDVKLLTDRGLFLATIGKTEAALADFNAALEREPKNPTLFEAKAMAQAELKKLADAEATVEAWRKIEPKSIVPLVTLARIRAAKPDLPAALAPLDEALKLEPDSVLALLTRATVYHEMKDKAKARADAEKARRLAPNSSMVRRLYVMILAQDGSMKEAIAEMEKYLRLAPEDRESLLQLGAFYSAEEHFYKAIHLFSQIIDADPANFMALRMRGDAYLGIGKHGEAIADYERAYKVKPADDGLLNNFAWVLATTPDDKLRNGKRALEMALEASKLTDYKQGHILSTLAAAYAETGDFQKALEWSEKAVAIGKEEQKEALRKELESYKAKKPVREMKNEAKDQPGDQPDIKGPPQPEKLQPPEAPDDLNI